MKITIKELRQIIREEIQNKSILKEIGSIPTPQKLIGIKDIKKFGEQNMDFSTTSKREKASILNQLAKIQQHAISGNHQAAEDAMYDLPDDVNDTMFGYYKHPHHNTQESVMQPVKEAQVDKKPENIISLHISGTAPLPKWAKQNEQSMAKFNNIAKKHNLTVKRLPNDQIRLSGQHGDFTKFASSKYMTHEG